MISAEQYRQTIGRFAGGRGGKRKMITNKTLDRQYRQTSSISPFHLILYLSYSILILILLGSMSRCTSSLSCRELCMETGREEVGKSINQHYIWYANCVLTLVIFKSMGKIGNTCSKIIVRCRLVVLLIFLSSLAKALIVIHQPSIVNPGPTEPKTKISVVYCNVNGLINMQSISGDQPQFQVSKLSDLRAYLFTYEPEIVVLNETWLNKHVNDGELVSDQFYTIYRKDRTKRDMEMYDKKGGGGVMILCKNNMGIEVDQVKDKVNLPIVTILLKSKNLTPICISTFYRYDYSGSDCLEETERYYTRLSRKYKNLAIIGDLNLSSVKDWDDPVSSNSIHEGFAHLFTSLGMSSLINAPTHRDGNVLDLILTNNSSCFSNVSVEENCLVKSDHFTIKCEVQIKKIRPKFKTAKKFSYKKADWDAINEGLIRYDWTKEFKHLRAEQSLQKFKSKLDITLRHHVPLVNVKIGSQPPWYDDELRQLKRSMDNSRKASLKFPNDVSLKNVFTCMEAEYRKASREKETHFLELSSIDESASTAAISKKFFKHVKSKTSSTRVPDIVHYEDNSEKSSQQKCKMFNDFFCKQFTQASTYSTPIDFDRNHDNDFNNETFHFDEVVDILRKLDASKATGPDNIDGIVLKKCHKSLAYPLVLIFNKVFDEGSIPTEWKNANVVPVHKKGDKSNVENYRPISLTCLIMKVFEKLVRERLYRACLEKVTPHQHGFVPLKSCTTQLIEFNCELAINLNQHLQTDIIYFDFQKAFDSVSHDVILEKLKVQYNINGKMLQFLKAYLSGRRQRVALDGEFSEWSNVKSGVPQGSILGPFLFVLFINDIVEAIGDEGETNIKLYADDLKIWRTIKNENDSLQPDIDRLIEWSVKNKMKFHPNKCKLLRCTLKHKPVNLKYYLGSSEIQQCTNETDLGVITNRKLSPLEHQNMIISKTSQRLGLVKRTSALVDSPLKRRTLYVSLVSSLFEHCSQIWRPVSASSIEKFEKLQKRALKWINNEMELSYDWKTYVSKLKQRKILPITERFLYNDLKLFHKIFYGSSSLKLPMFLHKYIPDRHDRRTTRQQTNRDQTDIIGTHNPNIDAFKHSYFYRIHVEWNNLPHDLRCLDSHDAFVAKLKDYLWNNIPNS